MVGNQIVDENSVDSEKADKNLNTKVFIKVCEDSGILMIMIIQRWIMMINTESEKAKTFC